jgi:hypothetical protein
MSRARSRQSVQEGAPGAWPDSVFVWGSQGTGALSWYLGYPRTLGWGGGGVAGGACVDAPGGRGGGCGLCNLCNCNLPLSRPAGPFGITLRAGCVMDGAVGVFRHCHWLLRTICDMRYDPAYGIWRMGYGVWRMAMAMASSCWLLGLGGLQRPEAEAAGTGALGLQLQLLSSQ